MRFFTLFFIKQLLLVPLHTSRKDLKFFSNIPGVTRVRNLLSGVYHHGVMILQGVILNWFTEKPKGAKYTRESTLPCDGYTGESLLLGLFVTRRFFVKLFRCLFQIHQEVDPGCIHHRGVEIPNCIHHGIVKNPCCIHHRGVETTSCFHHRGVILNTRELFC
jgi:hypothetical protein